MGKRGTFKYICDDCQAENWLNVRERTSRSKPRCVECGSPWLSLSKKSGGADKLSTWHEAKKEYHERQDKKMGKK